MAVPCVQSELSPCFHNSLEMRIWTSFSVGKAVVLGVLGWVCCGEGLMLLANSCFFLVACSEGIGLMPFHWCKDSLCQPQ